MTLMRTKRFQFVHEALRYERFHPISNSNLTDEDISSYSLPSSSAGETDVTSPGVCVNLRSTCSLLDLCRRRKSRGQSKDQPLLCGKTNKFLSGGHALTFRSVNSNVGRTIVAQQDGGGRLSTVHTYLRVYELKIKG